MSFKRINKNRREKMRNPVKSSTSIVQCFTFPSLLRYILITFLITLTEQALPQEKYETIIRYGRVLDGSGNPWFRTDIGIKGDRIAALGNLDDAQAEREIDASGLYVAPGFIDSHSHTSGGLTSEDRSHAQPLLAQGITTVFINPDGGGPVDIEKQKGDLLKHGLGINAAQLVPHGSIRRQVMGMVDRLPTETELEQMRDLVRKGMKAGAFGLSSGPFYAPGSYSDTRELVELAKIASEYGGVYTSHIRDESNYTIGVVAAVDEVIQIAREASLPGIVTHIKVLGPPVWGYSMAVVRRIDRARKQDLEIYADQYPYIASSTGLGAALLPRWAQAGGRDSLIARFENPATMAKIITEMMENLARRGGADRILFRRFQPDPAIEGRTLAEVADDWQMNPVEASIKMFRKGGPSIISFNMNEDDVKTFMVQSWTMTSSDGAYPKWGEGVPHPRAFGTFPRKIHKYVLEENVLELPAAIRSMTSLPAQVFRLWNRGVIRQGAYADLVIFDLDKLRDHATFTEPYHLSEGMVHVFVNGQAAILDGEFTDVMSGRVLSR